MFIKGNIYNRRRDLHEVYGGNRQSGISTCSKFPYVFIFLSPNGKNHGYEDKWISDSILEFCGEGQYGDMDLTRGNKSIKDHKKRGKELHVFQKVDLQGNYEYIGQFAFVNYETKPGSDTDKKRRKIILFSLERC